MKLFWVATLLRFCLLFGVTFSTVAYAERPQPCGSNSHKKCWFATKNELTHVFEQPSKDSKIIFTYDWPRWDIKITQEQIKQSHGWIKDSGEIQPIGQPRTRYEGWISLDTLVDPGRAKKVISCWPIGKFTYWEGEVEGDYAVKADGSFTEYIPHSRRIISRGHVYFTGDFVMLLTDREQISMLAGYDSVKRELRVSGGEDDIKQIHLPADQLQGCGSEPIVEDVPLAQANKPAKTHKP
jgi:hypothetical protein